MGTAITCKSYDGRYISERDCIAHIEGIDYPCSVLVSDAGDGYIVTLYKGMRSAEAMLMPAADSDMELALPAMLAGSNYNAALAQLADTLPADPAALNALATAAAELERAAAPAAVRNGLAADASAAQIAAASAEYKAARKARHAERDARRAAKAPALNDEIVGNGWRITFDCQVQRTRLAFERYPGKAVLQIVKAAGFSWNAAAREWRRGYNDAARRAALDLAQALAA